MRKYYIYYILFGQLSSEIVEDYVVTEAESVIDRVISAQGNRTFTFAAITDMHYGSWNYYEGITDYSDGIKHACQALKYIDERIKLDAVAVLGDYTDGMALTQNDTAIHDFKDVNAVLDKLRFAPNLRLQGNHDIIVPHSPITYRYIGAYSDGAVEWGNHLGGYFYKDFAMQKLRVIGLNTSELTNSGVSPTTEQYQWFINTLDLSAKENASEWQILILSHIPLDFWADNGAYKFAYILKAYLNGDTWSDGADISCNFANKNVAKIVGNIHGHTHNFTVDKLYLGNIEDATEQINIWRMATPNSCFGAENKNYSGYKQETAYPKTANSTTDTTFCVYCIDLDSCTIKAICYGAGYDRELNYDSGIIEKTYTISNNLTNVVNSNTTKNIMENGSYTATLTATNGDITSVIVTMGGVDITAIAYSNGIVSIAQVTGNVVITAVAKTDTGETDYTNVLPTATDKDGNIYNGVGYKANTRYSTSSNVEQDYDGVYLSGYIPYDGKNGTVYLENVTTTSRFVVWYYTTKGTFLVKREQSLSTSPIPDIVLGSDGNATSFTLEAGFNYIRIECGGLDSTSVITINEPISSDEPEEPIIVNVLATSTGADDSVYNGVGWKANTRYSGSSQVEKSYEGLYLSGYIPITEQTAYGTCYLKDVNFIAGGAGTNEIMYFTEKGVYEYREEYGNIEGGVYDENGVLTQFTLGDSYYKYFRIASCGFSDASIVTINQPIE